MKVLHTSDWHFGKNLEKYSRREEQIEFVEQLCNIVEENNIDLIIVCGDIYDTFTPAVWAENLLYKCFKKLTNNGKRPIVVIAGNHDNPEKLMTINPLAIEHGIIIVGFINNIVKIGKYEHFDIINSGEGFLQIKLNSQIATIVTIPYLNEKRLNEIFMEPEGDYTKNYEQKLESILLEASKNFCDDTINIIMGHFYIKECKIHKSEVDISLGGIFAISPNIIPKNTQYLAMGHLHKCQKIPKCIENAYYSGSPIQYDKTESYRKYVLICDILPNKNPNVQKYELNNYKPIEIWKVDGVEKAFEICKINKDKKCYVYLEIITDRPFMQNEIKELKSIKPDIVEIVPIFEGLDNNILEYEDKSILEQFVEHYFEIKKVSPSQELIKCFVSMLDL